MSMTVLPVVSLRISTKICMPPQRQWRSIDIMIPVENVLMIGVSWRIDDIRVAMKPRRQCRDLGEKKQFSIAVSAGNNCLP